MDNNLRFDSAEIGTHRNNFLYSDHYLNHILFGDKRWESAVGDAMRFFAWLQTHYQQEKENLVGYNESQLEENWFRPIFDQLGWQRCYETQTVIPALATAQIRKPDYLFYPDESQRRAAAQTHTTQNGLLVGEVKRWGVHLDKKSAEGQTSFDRNNPSHQIDYYLRSADIRWGLLSNGNLWRLVNKETSYKLDIYFEIDLHTAIEQNQQRAITYFYLFFRRQAFIPDERGRVLVEDALTESRQYAQELESDLRDNAYKALEQLIDGYFDYYYNQLDRHNEAHLLAVYENSLYLLYRLLFLFYGESRAMLPLADKPYRRISLSNLAEQIGRSFDDPAELPDDFSSQIWCKLHDLFQIVNGTNPALNAKLHIPCYNGGLFNPDLHPFLEQKKIADLYLARAIDYLARRDSHKQGDYARKEAVDYRTLGVRQLGSIYEGLLEYRPMFATEPMVTIRQKGAEIWLPAHEKGKAKVWEEREIGQLYLATDKGERKATGSYYTPDYIVKYIVEQTIDPLVEEIRQRVQSEAKDQPQQFIEGILGLRILDPSMGSGHFLVEATDYLARLLATDEWIRGESAEVSESDLVYWRRRVVESCIYGVDKNGMAVELGKLSLWLVTVASDKPLSFLDHHLRQGDSLVGVRLDALAYFPDATRQKGGSAEQLPLLNETALTQTLFQAVGGMTTIGTMLSESVEDVHHKAALLTELRQHLQKWRTMADLWTSYWFGNSFSREEYADLVRWLQGETPNAHTEQLQRFLDHPSMQNKDYFHWQLEFPEIFFDPLGRPLGDRAGFDAVIGNPPYFVGLDEQLRQYITRHFPLTGSGYKNLALHFLELGNRFARAYIGMIVPKSITYSEGWSSAVNLYWPHLIYAIDASRAWSEVLLEMVVLIADFRSQSPVYTPGQIEADNKAVLLSALNKDECAKFGTIICAASEQELQLAQTAWKNGMPMSEIVDNFRGKGLQSACRKQGTLEVLRGDSLAKYGMTIENYFSKQTESELKKKNQLERYIGKRVVAQNVVAHITTPSAHISIIATLANGQFPLDTVNNFILRSLMWSDEAFLGLLNSKFVAWYMYRFVFNKAIRTMHLDSRYTGKVPIPFIPSLLTEEERTQKAKQLEFFVEENEFEHARILIEQYAQEGLIVDQLGVAMLGGLAKEMLNRNRQKMVIAHRFSADLEGLTDAGLFAKLQKGKQSAVLHQTIPATQPFLSAESNKSYTLEDSLAWNIEAYKGMIKLLAGKVRGMADLLDLYKTYHNDYRSLTQRIEQTDRLIDQLVYQLYGLSAEEIALIESP